MITRLWHKLFHPSSPEYDPDADDNVTFFRRQRKYSEQNIEAYEQRRDTRDLTTLYGEMRPLWERDRTTRHEHS